MALMAVLVLAVVLALWNASDDAEAIGRGEAIDHAREWLTRAGAMLLVCLTIGDLWMAIPGGALFSIVFRARLNDLRGLPAWYISPSSWYDWQFLRLTWRPFERDNLMAAWRKEWNAPQTVDAGALAYTAEVMVVVCALIWMI